LGHQLQLCPFDLFAPAEMLGNFIDEKIMTPRLDEMNERDGMQCFLSPFKQEGAVVVAHANISLCIDQNNKIQNSVTEIVAFEIRFFLFF
jgi:hypothetical protein